MGVYKMKLHSIIPITALVLLSIASKASDLEVKSDPHTELQNIFQSYHEAYLKLNPMNAMFEGDYRFNDILGNDLTPVYLKQSEHLERVYVGKLKTVDYRALDDEDKISYEIFKYDRDISLEYYTAGFARMDVLLPISQFYSLPNYLAIFGSGGSAQPFNTVQDYENWFKRVGGLPAWVDQAIANLRDGIKEGIVLPKVIVEKTLPQLQAHLVDKVTDSVFYGPVRHMPEAISKADGARLTKQLESIIQEVIIPSYRRLHTFLKDEYLPKARASVGIGALPGGKSWYAYRVRQNTTTRLTPEEIHAIGKKEALRIYQEMVAIKEKEGFAGTLPEFFTYLKTDPSFKYKSVEDMLASYGRLKDDIEGRIPRLFSLAPRAALVIKPMESFRAASAAAAEYMGPAPDGSRPGVFYLNTYDLPSRLTWGRESLFLHEAIPGHHFQISIAQEQDKLPTFQRFDGPTAFVEGWGLYAETLGRELGLYTDLYQRMGALSNEIWRADRLVVDTGMHAMGWTREQAINWMKSNTPMSQTDIVAEVERYIAIPGQALAYKIGQMRLVELRNRAQRELDGKFDIREFHTQILKDGAMPLDILEKKINTWIEDRRSSG